MIKSSLLSFEFPRPYWLQSISVMKCMMFLVVCMLVVFLGAPVAHGLLKETMGADYDYGKAAFFGLISALCGGIIFSILILGIRRFVFHKD